MSSIQPIAYNRFNNKFYILNNVTTHNAKAFIDEDSYRKFKDFRKSDRTVKDLQRQGFALPIFKSKHHTGLFCDYLLEINRAYPPTSGEFSDDNFVNFCKVKVVHRRPYIRYDFEIPGQTVILFHHKNYPFADFEFNGVRYRWIKLSHTDLLNHMDYKFILYELPRGKLTFLSESNRGTIDNNHPLLGNFLGRKWFGTIKDKELQQLTTSKKIGQFDLTDRNLLGVKKGQFEINSDTCIKSIKDIPDDIMLFLSMITLFKLEQDIADSRNKKRRNRNAMNAMNNNFM
ncbi:hypothetical protein CLIB1444_02S07316 [[Candida] jaroonii]|uniref:Uncharacterized protein n=1 Tax=[Candida] jaroonii TaxID=467808 RepID=A0ACA9Y3Z9_9ASCO|nr:hypothetical protein CLIB1444_02S07316 [[Candida] jaroonii]